jgi:hypothetical protein
MKKVVLLLVLAVMIVGSVPVLADGMFYWTESIPPEIPYQRALLLFDGGYETLIVQSKYRMSSSETDEFGWVVPVPSVPELASIEPGLADDLFWELETKAQPRMTWLSDYMGIVAIICLLTTPTALILLLACLVSFFTPRLQFIRRHRGIIAVVSILLFVPAIYYIWPKVRMSRPGHWEGYRFLMPETQVGVYDVQVVKAGESGDLIQWLNENRFQFDGEDTQVFDEYLRRGWCFVVARVDPTRSADDKVLAEGLVAPLILRFQTVAPVYPLALTSMEGHDTQVLLYVLSENKWQNDGRLELEYAGEAHLRELEEVCIEALPDMPAGCFTYGALSFLCKFKGTLTPEKMEKDTVLVPAEDDEAYRKHITIW